MKLKAPVSFHLIDLGSRNAPRHETQDDDAFDDEAELPPHAPPLTVEDRLTAMEQSVVEMRGQIDGVQSSLDEGFETLKDYLDSQFADIRSRLPPFHPPSP